MNRKRNTSHGDAACVLDYVPLDLATSKWHHLTFVRAGNRFVATINDKHRVAGIHDSFTAPKKHINFACETGAVRFDNVSVRAISDVKASAKLFAKPRYSLSDFWAMREKKYGLPRLVIREKGNNKP